MAESDDIHIEGRKNALSRYGWEVINDYNDGGMHVLELRREGVEPFIEFLEFKSEISRRHCYHQATSRTKRMRGGDPILGEH